MFLRDYVMMMKLLTIITIIILINVPCQAWTPMKQQQRSHFRSMQSITMNLENGGKFVTNYKEISVQTKKGIYLSDLTPLLRDILLESGCREGVMTVLSRHTTTAITVNEMEGRLVDDIRQWLLKLAPPEYPYLHNDLHLRNGPPGWPGGDEAWRAQEPVNCHSHLLTMLLGSSESIPIHEGQLRIGTWQSVILAEMDGPRNRTVSVQITGTI